MKITTKLLGKDYLLTCPGTDKRNLKIKVYVSDDGMTIYNQNERLEFIFEDSKPEMIKRIAKLLLKAGEL